jgi:hypothetical protein
MTYRDKECEEVLVLYWRARARAPTCCCSLLLVGGQWVGGQWVSGTYSGTFQRLKPPA